MDDDTKLLRMLQGTLAYGGFRKLCASNGK
jgi:hypothetical protein